MLTVQYVKDPIYSREDGAAINCTVKFAEFNEEHIYTATSFDTEQHGRKIYNDLIAGKYGPIGAYVAPPPPPSPPEPPKPTIEQLQTQLAALTAQIAQLANTGS